MQSYPLSAIGNPQSDIFEQAAVEPVWLTEDSQPSYVIMSAHDYQTLLDQLAKLEDSTWGQAAETALQSAQMVGSEIFTAELKRLATIESTES